MSDPMRLTNTVIIGGGQAGLAMSRCLAERGIPHVVLERGRIGERWRSERWDSVRLLTPNWFSRLPHWHYRGGDPDGYMTSRQLVDYLEQYARSFDAPVCESTTVLALGRAGAGRYRVRTDRGTWIAGNVVIATGFCDKSRLPEFAGGLSADVNQLVPTEYRNPGKLPAGNVLIVGASATGAQLAEELVDAGRGVTLAVGTHVRLPRGYRGKDILWWMEIMGAFRAAADPGEERKTPPPQLVGRPDHRDLDLGTLQRRGVRLVGRAISAEGHRVRFADDLRESVEAADSGMRQLLASIDEFIRVMDLERKAGPPEEVAPIRVAGAPTEVDLQAEGIATVLWATGYRRSYPWLELPEVLDERGEIRHRGGITPLPGLYVLGMRFQRRKNSNFLDGVGNDAAELTRHLVERTKTHAA